MISASASPCARMAMARPFGFRDQRCFSAAASVSMRWRSISALQHGRDQLFLAAIDLGLLHLDLLLFLDLLHLHLLGDHLLLHDVGLDVVSFVGLRLLALW
jgi:hypothetical protein